MDQVNLLLPPNTDMDAVPFLKSCGDVLRDAGLHVLVSDGVVDDGLNLKIGHAFGGFWLIDRCLPHGETTLSNTAFDHHSVDFETASKFYEMQCAEAIKPFNHPFGFDDFVLVVLGENLGLIDSGAAVDTTRIISDVLEMEPERQVVIHGATGSDLHHEKYATIRPFDLNDRVSFSNAAIDRLLDSCRYVVTQNQTVNLQAMFHGKHTVQYARSAFHHISRKVYEDERLRKTYNRARRDRPEFQKYIYWLCHEHLTNENDPQILRAILDRCRTLG
ncbi:hypothetical protein [Paramylibacter kogurei]|uniref:hypothetical protein n=1 Tax=Paramylibacter kogurei TaxID=1889778 RepID=UPI00105438F4|nr:hypothetical protein [Amylibacter kogurei]